MQIVLTIQASTDRDPEGNIFTLTKVFTYRLSEPPTGPEIRERLQGVEDLFKSAWHRRGTNCPRPVMDASIKEIDN